MLITSSLYIVCTALVFAIGYKSGEPKSIYKVPVVHVVILDTITAPNGNQYELVEHENGIKSVRSIHRCRDTIRVKITNRRGS